MQFGRQVGEVLLLVDPNGEFVVDALNRLQRVAENALGIRPARESGRERLAPRDLGRQHGVLEILVARKPQTFEQLRSLLCPGRRGLPAACPILLQAGLERVDFAVEAVRRREEVLACRAGANREVAIARQGSDCGENVVLGPVRGKIPHVCGERLSLADGVPEKFESRAGHLRVSDDVVGRGHQLVVGVMRKPNEHLVRRFNDALRVSHGKEQLVDAERMHGAGWNDMFGHVIGSFWCAMQWSCIDCAIGCVIRCVSSVALFNTVSILSVVGLSSSPRSRIFPLRP